MTPPKSEYRAIQLTRGQVAYVSPHRHEELAKFKWFALWAKRIHNFYAARSIRTKDGRQRMLLMHRYILGLGAGDKRQADHVDRRFTLNNTDDNLRIATPSQQNHNQGRRSNSNSPYKGVRAWGKSGLWEARITVGGVRRSLGLFPNPQAAHAAYCDAGKSAFGDFFCAG